MALIRKESAREGENPHGLIFRFPTRPQGLYNIYGTQAGGMKGSRMALIRKESAREGENPHGLIFRQTKEQYIKTLYGGDIMRKQYTFIVVALLIMLSMVGCGKANAKRNEIFKVSEEWAKSHYASSFVIQNDTFYSVCSRTSEDCFKTYGKGWANDGETVMYIQMNEEGSRVVSMGDFEPVVVGKKDIFLTYGGKSLTFIPATPYSYVIPVHVDEEEQTFWFVKDFSSSDYTEYSYDELSYSFNEDGEGAISNFKDPMVQGREYYLFWKNEEGKFNDSLQANCREYSLKNDKAIEIEGTRDDKYLARVFDLSVLEAGYYYVEENGAIIQIK